MRDYQANHYVALQSQSKSSAYLLASQMGGQVESEGVGMLPDHYIVRIPKRLGPSMDASLLEKRSKDAQSDITWVQEQVPYNHLYKRGLVQSVKAENVQSVKVEKRNLAENPTLEHWRKALDIHDPGFSEQWHLLNLASPGFDLNITGVWMQGSQNCIPANHVLKGITGTNVTVALIDDGLDHENPDLKDNFSLEGSYDYNEHKQLPTPALFDDTHGTRCAGEVAAMKNDVCGVGIAYTAKVAGLRVLSGSLTNEDEARAVTYACNTTQIYSCSWGPRDDGRTVEAPPEIVSKAFEAGIKYCRHGLGSIYVFAAGNGGASEDNCNADGYTNSIYTITVAAMDSSQGHPPYSERCSATLISMYSNHGSGMTGIYTTDWQTWGRGCTSAHGGTSAAAPLASGIYALVLSIRPDLSWRDVQRLSIENAVIVNPSDEDWFHNGANRLYNHKYGYGTFDTYKLLESAKLYKRIGTQTKIEAESGKLDLEIPQNTTGVSSTITITEADIKKSDLFRLEHIQITIDIQHTRRGDIAISLVSPSNFTSKLMESRSYDGANNGFKGWTMMSVAHWDESPLGKWKLIVYDRMYPENGGKLENWKLILWGESHHNPNTENTVHLPIPPLEGANPTTSIPAIEGRVSAKPDTKNSTSEPLKTEDVGFGADSTTAIISFILVSILLAGLFRYFYMNRGKVTLSKRRKVLARDGYDFEEIGDLNFEDDEFDVLAMESRSAISRRLKNDQEKELLFEGTD